MEELPTTLSPDAAAAIVALVERSRADVIAGVVVAVAIAAAAWLLSARWLVAAIALCVTFPVAARGARAVRLGRLRRLDAAVLRQRAAAAWQKASPGQRAALQMIVKKSA